MPYSASQDEIKAAYRKLAMIYHPDKNPANRIGAELKLKKIINAKELLLRKDYNQNDFPMRSTRQYPPQVFYESMHPKPRQPSSDCQIAYAAYFSMNGHKRNFIDPSKPCCDTSDQALDLGIICDKQGRIIELNWESQGFSEKLYSGLGNLLYLKRL